MEGNKGFEKQNKEELINKETLLESVTKDRLFDLMVDIQTESSKANKRKDFLIGILIAGIIIEAIGGFWAFAWYESLFETTKTVEVYTEGENANAEYNDVEGDQYNDDSVHNE